MAKWKVFKERVPEIWCPMWVLWDDHGEHLFHTGKEALEFVNKELNVRGYAEVVRRRQEMLDG